jgi:hypothetical protein
MKGKTRGNRTKRLVARNEGMVGIEMIFRFASVDTIQNVLSSLVYIPRHRNTRLSFSLFDSRSPGDMPSEFRARDFRWSRDISHDSDTVQYQKLR